MDLGRRLVLDEPRELDGRGRCDDRGAEADVEHHRTSTSSPVAAERYAASTTATAARPSAAVTVGARSPLTAARNSSSGELVVVGELDPAALARCGHQGQRRPRVEVERALGADHRELVVRAWPSRPAGVDRADRTGAHADEELRIGLDIARLAVQDRRDVRDVVTRHGPHEIDGVHAKVDQAPSARRGALEEPGRLWRPRLRTGVPEGDPEAGDIADGALAHLLRGRRERRREPRVLERNEHTPGALGGGDHLVGIGDRARHRLVDEHVLARAERGHRDGVVLRVRRGDDDRVDVVAPDRVLPAVLDRSRAPRRAGRLRRRERSAREHGDLCTRRPQRRKVDVVRGGAAADHGESNGHERCCSASLRTVVPTCSQSASEYATPTGTMSDRPTSASVCGHRPGPYSRAVG